MFYLLARAISYVFLTERNTNSPVIQNS